MIESNIKNAGDIVWDICRITNVAGTSINIDEMMVEMEIYENLFSHFISGKVYMVDTKNLIDTFPIIGQEELYVDFYTPGQNDSSRKKFTKKFRIVSVKDREISGNKQTYVLHFISYEAWVEQTYRETKSFHGTSDVIIKALFSKLHAKYDELTVTPFLAKTPMIVGESKPLSEMKFVSPHWLFSECAKFAANNSISSINVADFLFFETRTGFILKSLSEMFVEQPIDYFKFDASAASDSNLENRFNSIKNMMFITSDDQLERVLFGAYGKRFINHDLLTKRIKYEKSFVKIPTLNGHESYFKNDFKFDPTYNIGVCKSYSYTFDEIVNDNQGVIDSTRNISMSKLEFKKLRLDIWGRSWLDVGKPVFISFGSGDESKIKTEGESTVTSGKYIVTAIMHRLAVSQHIMTLEVVKESNLSDLTVMQKG
jgi:hypothetical protein